MTNQHLHPASDQDHHPGCETDLQRKKMISLQRKKNDFTAKNEKNHILIFDSK